MACSAPSEEYDFGGLPTDDGIVEIEGYYASRGPSGERATWFHDSEGNLLGISELVYA